MPGATYKDVVNSAHTYQSVGNGWIAVDSSQSVPPVGSPGVPRLPCPVDLNIFKLVVNAKQLARREQFQKYTEAAIVIDDGLQRRLNDKVDPRYHEAWARAGMDR